MRESPHATYPELAADLIEGIAEFLDRPFALFGHCGSALAAYETAAQLAARGGPIPDVVFISSQVAPQDGPYGTFFGMDDAQLAEELRALSRSMGSEPLPDLIELTLELTRTDMAANACYHLEDPPRLPCRLAVIGWAEDSTITPAMMTGWARCGRTTFHTLPGGHYRFLRAPEELVRLLRWETVDDREGTAVGTVTIEVDAERCVGSGTCMAIAPDRFRFDDEDRSRPVRETVDEDVDIHTAADMCPTAAITVHRTSGNAAAVESRTS